MPAESEAVVSNNDDVPHATKVGVGYCPDPECRCVHMALFMGEREIAHARMPVCEITSFIDDIRRSAYAVLALKD